MWRRVTRVGMAWWRGCRLFCLAHTKQWSQPHPHVKKKQVLPYLPLSLNPTTQSANGPGWVSALVEQLFLRRTSQRGDAGAAALDDGGDFVKVAGAYFLLVRYKVFSHTDVVAPVCICVAQRIRWNLTYNFIALW